MLIPELKIIFVEIFLTLSLWGYVHAMLDLHVSTEVTLQVESAGAVRALKWLAAGMEMHVAQKIIHSVE